MTGSPWTDSMPLTAQRVADLIDHALLRPELTPAQVRAGIEEVAALGVWSVCVRPSDVLAAAAQLAGRRTRVGAVIGFPHGSTSTAAKVAEAAQALADGAVELDMVLHIGRLIGADLAGVRNDIAAVVDLGHEANALVKVILETSLLGDDDKVAGCAAAQDAGADFVKTSTGFGGGGATTADVRLMRAAVSEDVLVKASGGIRTLDQGLALVAAGARRLGVSSTVALLREAREREAVGALAVPDDVGVQGPGPAITGDEPELEPTGEPEQRAPTY